jgi:hypothetical protein
MAHLPFNPRRDEDFEFTFLDTFGQALSLARDVRVSGTPLILLVDSEPLLPQPFAFAFLARPRTQWRALDLC